MDIYSSRLKEAKQQSSRLKTRLSELGVTIKHSQALEAIAAINKHPDWNHYAAALKDTPVPYNASPVFKESFIDSFNDSILALRNLISKVGQKFSYQTDNNLTLLAMAPGKGKSLTLQHLIADSLNQNETCIYVDCLNGSSLNYFSETILNKATVIQADLHDAEIPDIFQIPEKISNVLLFKIDFGNLNHHNRQYVFSRFLNDLLRLLPSTFLSGLAYLLVDDFQSIGLQDENVALGFNKIADKTHAKVIVADTYFNKVKALKGQPFSIITRQGTLESFTSIPTQEFDYYRNTKYYLVDLDGGNSTDTFNLADRQCIVRNIAKLVAFKLNKSAHAADSGLPIFVNNPEYRYFNEFMLPIA